MDTPRAPGAGPTAVRALRVAARALTVTGDARAATAAPGGADGGHGTPRRFELYDRPGPRTSFKERTHHPLLRVMLTQFGRCTPHSCSKSSATCSPCTTGCSSAVVSGALRAGA